MKKKIIGGVFIAVIAVGSVFFWQYKKSQKQDYNSVEAAKGDVVQDVFATGTVVPSKALDLSYEVSGKVSDILVHIGDNVEAGDALMRINDTDYALQILEAQASLASARANLKKVEAGISSEDVDVSKITLENAEKNLEQVKISVEADISSAEQSLASAKVSLDNAESNLEDVKKDAENDLQDSYDDALSSFDGVYLDAFDAVDDLDEILSNILFTSFCVYNSQLKINIQNQNDLAVGALSSLKVELDFVKANPSAQNIDSALAIFKEKINIIKEGLNLMSEGLINSDASLSFSQTSLNTYKSNISADIIAINTNINSLDSDTQSIKNVKLANEININAAERSVGTAQSSVNSAEQALAAAKVKADSQIVSAENQVELAKKQLILKESGVENYELELAKAQVDQAEAALSKANYLRQKTVISAPISGIITAINKEAGETVVAGEKIIGLISHSEYQIEADISESDIVKIDIADSVKTTFDAFGPDKSWTGKVVKIDPAERVIQGVVYYKITVDLGVLEKVKSGMTANLTILTDKKEDVLYIPSRAIIRKDGAEYVRILGKDGFIEERRVVSGLKGSEGDVEIIEGISAGDTIVLSVKE